MMTFRTQTVQSQDLLKLQGRPHITSVVQESLFIFLYDGTLEIEIQVSNTSSLSAVQLTASSVHWVINTISNLIYKTVPYGRNLTSEALRRVLCALYAFQEGTELESVRRVTGNIVSNQVTFLLKPDDNNAEYTCNASNNATTEPLVTAVNLRVSCVYLAVHMTD